MTSAGTARVRAPVSLGDLGHDPPARMSPLRAMPATAMPRSARPRARCRPIPDARPRDQGDLACEAQPRELAPSGHASAAASAHRRVAPRRPWDSSAVSVRSAARKRQRVARTCCPHRPVAGVDIEQPERFQQFAGAGAQRGLDRSRRDAAWTTTRHRGAPAGRGGSPAPPGAAGRGQCVEVQLHGRGAGRQAAPYDAQVQFTGKADGQSLTLMLAHRPGCHGACSPGSATGSSTPATTPRGGP